MFLSHKEMMIGSMERNGGGGCRFAKHGLKKVAMGILALKIEQRIHQKDVLNLLGKVWRESNQREVPRKEA